MPNELRVRANGIGGKVEDNPLTAAATVLTSAGLAAVPAIGTTQHLAVVLDPDGIDGAPEIVWITAHTATAITATILRAQEGTTARQHLRDTDWIHGATVKDFAPRESIWIGARLMTPEFGSPTLGMLGTTGTSESTEAWLLDASAHEVVGGLITIPADWLTHDSDIYWANAGAGTGAAAMRIDRLKMTAGATVVGRIFGGTQVVTALAQNLLVITTAQTGQTWTGPHRVQVERDASNASDTLGNDIGIIGIEYRRTS